MSLSPDRMMADLIAGLLRRTGEAMAMQRPYGDADERRVAAALPPPVLPVRMTGVTSCCMSLAGSDGHL